jgi:DNA-binding beta-propeller fold protein YncE
MKRPIFLLAAVLFAGLPGQPQTAAPLKLIQTIEMPNVPVGPYTDHLIVDLKGHRLFTTPQAHHSVQVFDLDTGKLLHEITGLGNAHAVAYRSDLDRIYVVDGEPGLVRSYDGRDYHALQSVKLRKNADSMTSDPDAKFMYVANGGEEANEDFSFVSVVDTSIPKDVADIRIDAAVPEQMVLEEKGPRLYVDITDKNEVGVIDREKRTLVATWPITEAKKPIAIALDEAHHRLFVGCRNTDMEGAIVVFDTQTGKETGTTLPTGGWVDYLGFDPATGRLYASCGTGYVYVYQQRDPDHYDLAGRAETAVMAKTGLLVPELHRFFVSVPHIGGTPAKVLVFETE